LTRRTRRRAIVYILTLYVKTANAIPRNQPQLWKRAQSQIAKLQKKMSKHADNYQSHASRTHSQQIEKGLCLLLNRS
jgi:hypothetical protein